MKLTTQKLGLLSITLVCSAVITSCGQQDKTPPTQTNTPDITQPEILQHLAEIKVTNPSKFKRESQPVYVSFYDLGLAENAIERVNLSVKIQQQR